MTGTHSCLTFVCAALLCLSASPAVRAATPSPLDLGVSAFSCTNVPISEALSLLSRKAPIPINCVIDATEEPHVSLSLSQSTLDVVLRSILHPLTNYDFLVKSGTLLVIPKGLLEDKSFPLNHPMPEYEVTYDAIVAEVVTEGPRTLHICRFDNPHVNVCPSTATFEKAPPASLKTFPVVRRFKNQSLLEILTAISSEWNESWSCGRVRPDFIGWYNNRERKGGVPINEMWWPDESLPCYWIEWGSRAQHGEYAYTRQTTDKQGVVRWSNVTVGEAEEAEQQQEAKNRASLERVTHFRTVEDSIFRGMHSAGPSPVQIHVEIATPEISNRTVAVEVSLTITNTTPGGVSILNPYRGDLQEAFWSIRVERKGDGAQYEIALPETEAAPEPEDLALAPYSTSTRVVNILGVKTLLDDKYTDPGFSGPVADELKQPGEYKMTVWLYFKEASGVEHCLIGWHNFTIK